MASLRKKGKERNERNFKKRREDGSVRIKLVKIKKRGGIKWKENDRQA